MVKTPCNNCLERAAFYATFEDRIPFTDEILDANRVVRTFDSSTPAHLLKWHFDEEDRYVIPLNDNDWQFQMDNELPQPINKPMNIPKGIYHRIIKGTTPLIVQINKNGNNSAGISA